jgi:D-alanyl-D-alanine carboxypeptidase
MLATRATRVILLGFGALLSAAAHAGPALVVDVDSGKVLYAEHATDPWFPASITKLMTTYVALDMVRSGRASMDQLLTVSPQAASQSPTKMGFPAGTQVTLDNALKMIMVKSANDMAAAIAENLGGSIEGFALMMNEAAARIGMRESRWVNPNGLPEETQQTSARDMAILGRALLREFPDNRDLFSISAIKFGRRIMPNHNGLLGRYAGVDGMKTGFTCSSGFNVVASATRDGRRLITVVMGSRKSQERTLKAADLFERGFALATWQGRSLEDLPPSSVLTPPDLRSYVCGRGPAPKEDTEAVVAGEAGTNADQPNQLPASALAFAGVGTDPKLKAQGLPPRAALEPVLVWTGRDPAEAKIAAEEDAAKPMRRGRRARVAAKPEAEAEAEKPAAKAAAVQAARAAAPARRKLASRRAQAVDAAPRIETPSIIDDGKSRRKRAVDPAKTLAGTAKRKRVAAAEEDRPAASKPAGSKKAARSESGSGKAGAKAKTGAKAKADAKAKAGAKTKRKSEDYAAGATGAGQSKAKGKVKRAKKSRDDD